MLNRIFFAFILAVLLVSCTPAKVSDSAHSKPVFFEKDFDLAVLNNGWYQFTERQAGYTINYPQNAYLTVSRDVALEYPQILITLNLPEDFQNIQIIVYSNPEKLSLKEIVLQNVYQEELLESEINKLALEPIKIAGLDAMKLEKTPFLPGIFISANSKVYFISLPMKMLMGDPPSPESVDLFCEVINTFSLEQ